MDEIFEFFIGIDWGCSRHQACVLNRDGKTRKQRSFAHSGQELKDMCDWLLKCCGGDARRIAVAIEVTYGPVVETLLDRGFAVFCIHPKQLDRFRDRFSASGAKDDRRDAHVAGEAVRTDRAHLRRLSVRDPLTVRLGEWGRIRAELIEESVILTNRLRSHLWRYFPAFLVVAKDLSLAWIIALWSAIPSPSTAASAPLETVADLLKGHGVQRFDAQKVLEILRQPAPTVAPGTVEAAQAHCRLLFDRLRLVLYQQKEAERALAALLAEWNDGQRPDPPGSGVSAAPDASPPPGDAEILMSMPGLGRVGVATLLSDAGDLVKERNYQGLRLRTGAAPVTRQSGKTKIVLRRYACSHSLRNVLFHWARTACQNDETCAARYKALREKGQSYGRALRTVGDRLLAVVCAMLKNRTLYDRQKAKSATP